MNPFVTMLASDSTDPAPDVAPTKFDVDDNVGEGIHIHVRNVRIELTVADFDTFADEMVAAKERMNDGNR